MKFLCDDNLGKLAKYLRMLGLDTFFRIDISDAKLLGIMLKQNRIVLTRDNQLIKRIEPERYLLIESDSPEEQLKAVVKRFDLDVSLNIDDLDRSRMLFSRCLECNDVCDDVDKDEIIDEVFPYIIKTQDSFKRCPSCRRIFWQGSHYKDMVKKLADVVNEIRNR
ncbi:MAG: hypothetical protein GY839_06310 [candidate division Zixibacteria bacterium]|nr:hypothetical protein [candidate division Zixibacteria bacterium]